METPNVPINFVPAQAGETFKLGTITIRIMEDGSRTVGLAVQSSRFHHGRKARSLIGTRHDETFLVTQGALRFHVLNGETIDAKQGDYVVVPTRAPHTFSNPFDEEAKFFNTFTPSFYINYFKILASLSEAGKPMTAEANRKAMAYFATIGVAEEEMKKPEERGT